MENRYMKLVKRVLSLIMVVLLLIPGIISTGFTVQASEDGTKITDLKVEYRNNPIGIDVKKPRFSWRMESAARGQKQTAYQLLVATSPDKLTPEAADVWNSGKVLSGKSAAIEYGGGPFQASTRYHWTVIVWDKAGQVVKAREGAFFETGILSTDGVTGWGGAKWISLDKGLDALGNEGSAPMLRKETPLAGNVKSARLYISALGVFDAYINGKKLGIVNSDGSTTYELLPPGWTVYNKNVSYMTYDVTSYIQGDNRVTLAATLGNGWYNGRISTGALYYNPNGNELALQAKLFITYDDNTTQTIVTDTTSGWKATDTGPHLANDIYDGETYDATKEIEGWNNNGFTDSGWKGVKEHPHKLLFPTATVTSYNGKTAQIIDELDQTPISVTTYNGIINQESSRNGKGEVQVDPTRTTNDPAVAGSYTASISSGDTIIYDLGQNMVGVPRITVKGQAGTQIKLRFGEMVNDDSAGADGPKGSIYTANLRSAKASSFYTLKGREEGETYQPSLTFFGFRYVEVTVLSEEATVEIQNMTGKVATSAIDVAGTLETSDQHVNKLISNIQWGQRGNYLWIPTDCPQRDERLGWTGDAQVFAKTGAYNMESYLFSENFIDILVDSQRPDGSFPVTAPNSGYGLFPPGASGWSDAAIVIPWTNWQMSGDTTSIKKVYKDMVEYMDWIFIQTGVTYRGPGSVYGDWLAFQGTSNALISDVYYAYDAKLMADMARAIGNTADAYKYETLFANIKREFIRNHIEIDENGKLTMKSGNSQSISYDTAPKEDNSQTSLLWALKLGLYENENQKQQMIDLLVENIRNTNEYKAANPTSTRVNYAENTLSVGFLGINVLAPVLSEVGHSDLSYGLLLQDDMPSWLFSVKNGATTIWERWNSYSKEDGFNPDGMNSFNHFSYGAIGEWMYSDMAGISNDPTNPGFKHTILKPTIDFEKRIKWAKGSFKSVYGTIESSWKTNSGTLTYKAVVPANTTATLYLPAVSAEVVTEGGQSAAKSSGVTFIKYENGKAVYKLESGSYQFQSVIQ
ncbi:MAG: family 78 glycoside hydrolase catalytic domain [Bacillota bacterium]